MESTHGDGALTASWQQTGDLEMIRLIFSAAAALALATTATAATKPAATKAAATKPVQCKDTKGKFIKCPAPVAKAVAKSQVAVAQKSNVKTSVASKRCRDAKGRFAKCGMPGAK
jgi:ABC-type Fe3+-hydroxamate transport system substrate-binding protein